MRQSNDLISSIVDVLRHHETRAAVIGATAMAIHGAPRATIDVDLLTTDARALDIEWDSELPDEVTVSVRRGDSDDPLRGVVTLSDPELTCDVVVGRWKWQTGMVDRATEIVWNGSALPVIQAADLAILKIDAGGYRDFVDVELLIERLGPHLIDDMERRFAELPSELRKACREFLENRTGRVSPSD